MSNKTYAIEVTVRVTESESFTTRDLAAATVKDRAPWDELKPTAVRFALDGVVEDAVARVNRQLKAEHAVRLEAERNEEVEV